MTDIFDELPENAIDIVKLWDDGEIIWSVEMSGMGPNYEYGIQKSMIEIIRRLKTLKKDDKNNGKKLDAALSAVDKKFNIGHSGASASVSKDLAGKFLIHGYRKMLKTAPKSRLIQVKRMI